MSSSYRATLDNWLKELDVKASDRVLDIGGSQLPVKGRTKSWDVEPYNYYILDLEEPHVGSPRYDYPVDMNQPLTNMVLLKFAGEAEIIFCLEVFEYIWNPVQAFANIAELLAKNGTAWVTFPSFYPHHQPIEDDSLRYMQTGIVKLAESAGLSIEQMIKRRPETNALQQFFSAERMRAAKDFDHNLTGWIVELKK